MIHLLGILRILHLRISVFSNYARTTEVTDRFGQAKLPRTLPRRPIENHF